MSADTITVLRAPTRRLAKLVKGPGDIQGYDRARTFNAAEWQLSGLADLHGLLAGLMHHTDCCVVRGALIDGPVRGGIRRLLYATTDGTPPTLLDVPRRWLALDMDGLARPAAVAVGDVAGCAAEAITHLPEPFHGAAYSAQATGGHGFKPGMRLRLWFWLSRPTWGAELKRWLGGAPVDPSIFSAAQVVYAAAPVFAPGVVDPVPQRVVEHPGAAEVQVPEASALAAPPRRPPPALTPDGAPWGVDWPITGERAVRMIERQVYRVRCAAEGARHYTLRAAARTIGGVIEQTALSEDEVIGALVAAAEEAGAEDISIAQSTVRWGLENGRRSPLVEGGAFCQTV